MKRSMKTMFVIATLACGVSFNAFAAEGGAAPGKNAEELSKSCAACHGADGNGTNAQYPRLSGQYHDYLARALQEYKTGERQNAIMKGFVATLSEADIDLLARYYADMPSKLDDLAHHEQGSD
jgi:cytochrome c553